MQEPLDALVAGDDGARENREHDGHAGQVLDASIAEGEALARLLAGKPESHGKRDRGRGVAEIVNRIGEQRDTAGDEYDNELQQGRAGEAEERPLDRP